MDEVETPTEKRSYDEIQDSDEDNKENVPPPQSPPRVRRRNIESVYSLNNIKLSLSKPGLKGASCLLTCIVPADVKHGESKKDGKDYTFKQLSAKGVLSNLDSTDKETLIRVPFDKLTKDMTTDIERRMMDINKIYPDEKYTPFPDFCIKPSTIVEITSFADTIEPAQPGDIFTVTDLVASINFTKAPKEEKDKKSDESTGRIRPVNVPYISLKGKLCKRGALTAHEFKVAVSAIPLNTDPPKGNRFLNEDGALVFPEDVLCYPNPSQICRIDIPVFTRLTPNDLFDIWGALYNPRAGGFGIIRNRLGLYDQPPLDELEPQGGLPVFTLLNIPRVRDKEYYELLYKKDKVYLKCARGKQETSNQIVAKQQAEDQKGLFYADQPILCTTFSVYENRPKGQENVPQYIDGIGILSPDAWERYATAIFRSMEALIYVKPDKNLSKELSLMILSDAERDEQEQQLAPCTHGIRGPTVLMPMMYKTLMGAGLRVSAEMALWILVEAQKNSPGKKVAPNMLRSRYAMEDPYCLALVENRNSVKHFLANAFDGDISDLPTSSDTQWEYFLVPAESTLHEIYDVEMLKNDLLTLRVQSFWTHNNKENCVELNDEIAKQWCTSKNVVNEMGVFCAKKERY